MRVLYNKNYIYRGKCPVEKLGMDENFVDVTQLVDEKMTENDNPIQSGYTFGPDTETSCCNITQSTGLFCECHKRLKIGSQIAQKIRQSMFEELGLTSSCGIAHNKLLAKIGGGKNKPNKQTVIFHETATELMLSLSKLRAIPGKFFEKSRYIFGYDNCLYILKLEFKFILRETMGVFFCDSLDLCYDPCHVIKHES